MGGDGMMGWFEDLRFAARRLQRSPGFTLTALTILVLGIGVNSTAFSVVNALLLQPPPFQGPERIVLVLQDDDGGRPSSTSYPAYEDMAQSDVFESVSAFYNDQGFLSDGDALAPLLVEYATASYVNVIGLHPSRGTWFEAEHDDPTGPPAAVLTHGMWADRLASDPSVIGSVLRVNGGSVTVVGVGPPEFNGGQGPTAVDMWLSISAMRATGGRAASLTRRQDHPFSVRARLAEGVSLEQARGAMDILAGDLAKTYPELNADRRISVLSVLDVRVTPEADAELTTAAALSMGIVVLVLVIGTLNLANLLLVRSTARAREIAVRLALGAGAARVFRVIMAEAVLLAGLGGVGGLALAAGFTELSRNSRLDFTIPVLLDLRLDGRVIGFTIAMSVLTGVVFGLVPAMRAMRRDVTATLRDDAAGFGRRRLSMTGTLVAGQVAVSLVLLAAAGTFVAGLARAQGTDPGFNWESTGFVQISAAPLGLEDEATLALYDQIEDRIASLPGVDGVTTSLMLPASLLGTTTLLLGADVTGADRPTEVPWNYVSAAYFDVLDIELLHGRLLEDSDRDVPGAALVSEAFAMTYFGRPDVVGRTYRSEGNPDVPLEIIGVVENTIARALGEPPTPTIYWPLDFAYPRVNFIVKVDGDASTALAGMRDVIRQVDPRIMVLEASSMGDHLGDTLQRERLASSVLAGLGGLALLLAMLGVYGVVSFAVSRRRREVGIRIALGAGAESVVGLFVREVGVVVAAGAMIGVGLSIPLGRVLNAVAGFGGNPAVTAGVTLLLLTTSLLATVVPARRAARTDPTTALRQE
jgi:predicted permease